jgi:hypothetical protein
MNKLFLKRQNKPPSCGWLILMHVGRKKVHLPEILLHYGEKEGIVGQTGGRYESKHGTGGAWKRGSADTLL